MRIYSFSSEMNQFLFTWNLLNIVQANFTLKQKKSPEKAKDLSVLTGPAPEGISRLILIGAKSNAKTLQFFAWIQIWKLAHSTIHLKFFCWNTYPIGFSYMLSCIYSFLFTQLPFLLYLFNLAPNSVQISLLSAAFFLKKIKHTLSELDELEFLILQEDFSPLISQHYTHFVIRRCKSIFPETLREFIIEGTGCGCFAISAFVFCWTSQIWGQIWN